jgi:hypothetical protein
MIRRCRLALRRIEGDPKTVYRVHLAMSRFWVLATPVLLFVVFTWSDLWLKIGLAYVMVASNYANYVGDVGAMAAADAATDEAITEHAIKAGETEG